VRVLDATRPWYERGRAVRAKAAASPSARALQERA
jgi:hypothetical protein